MSFGPHEPGCEIDSDYSATLRLEPRLYSREAILRASYWGSATAHIYSPESNDESLVVRIKLKIEKPTLEQPNPLKIHDFLGQFLNSLNDFELRRQVETETAPIRQMILAKAFSESGLLEDEPPGDTQDPVEEKKSSLVRIAQNAPHDLNDRPEIDSNG